MVMSIPYYISLGTGDSDLSPVLPRNYHIRALVSGVR